MKPVLSAVRALGERLIALHPQALGVVRSAELLVFALALPIGSRLMFPNDPLGFDNGFAWVAIGPIALAARYGVAQGLACALIAVAAFGVLMPAGAAAPTLGLSIGTLVLTLIVGDAASAIRRRGRQAEAENGYLRHRLKEFSNDYHVLKVSHGQLEEHLAGSRLSLRQALQRLEPALATRSASIAAGEELMAVFAQFCSLQVAGLYTLKNGALVEPEALATLGDMGELPQFDPLLKLALAERRVVSVQSDAQAENRHGDGLLAVVPIVDSRDRLHGVLAIRDMHFMAYQQKNLNLLALLAGYIGDRIARSGSLDQGSGQHFMAELDTALRFVRTHDVEAALVTLRLGATRDRERIAARLCDSVRSLDCAWRPPSSALDGEQGCVVVLLPLVGRDGANAWLDRVSDELAAALGVDLREQLLSARILLLEATHERRDCLEFVRGIGGRRLADGAIDEDVRDAA